jgi:membrane protein involved in colicin uptake
MRCILFAAVILAIVSPAGAGAQTGDRIMCSQPVMPTCVDSDLTYEDQQRINRCERDFKNFEEQVEDYIDCLAEKSQAQRERLESLREEFECRQAGGGDC